MGFPRGGSLPRLLPICFTAAARGAETDVVLRYPATIIFPLVLPASHCGRFRRGDFISRRRNPASFLRIRRRSSRSCHRAFVEWRWISRQEREILHIRSKRSQATARTNVLYVELHSIKLLCAINASFDCNNYKVLSLV